MTQGFRLPRYFPSREEQEFWNSYLGIPHTTQPHSDGTTTMQVCYTVLDKSRCGGDFYGVYDSLEDAVHVANENGGADILKCTMNGISIPLVQRPCKWRLIQRISLDRNATRPDQKYQQNDLGVFDDFQKMSDWLHDYCRVTFPLPADARYTIRTDDHMIVEVHTQRVQRRPDGSEMLQGGIYVGTINTEATEYSYCESVIGMNT